MRPSPGNEPCFATTAARVAILLCAFAMMPYHPICIKIEAFTPSPYRAHSSHHQPLHIPSTLPQPPLSLHKSPHLQIRTNRSTPSSISTTTTLPAAAAAASAVRQTAWLFTPDRTAGVIGGVLADTASEVIHTGASLATDAALEAAALAADLASPVTTEIVRTIYKAPFWSLAISFLLGGLFFSTVAAFFGAVFSFGKENSRRAREVIGIVVRRNWAIFKTSMQFTMVSFIGLCCCQVLSKQQYMIES